MTPTLDLALAAQILVWLAVILVFFLFRQASPFHPLTFYLLFHGVVFVARPLLVCYLHFDEVWRYMGFEPSESDLLKSLAVSSVALVIFAAACMIAGRCRPQFSSQGKVGFGREQVTALAIVTVLLLPLIGRSIFAGVSGEATGREIGATYIMTGATGYTVEAQYMLGPLICGWLAVTGFRWQIVAMVFPYLLYRAYGGWSRWTIVLFVAAVGLVYLWHKRTKWPAFWMFACVIPAFLLFNALGRNREYVQQVLHGGEFRQPVDHPGVALVEKWRLKYDGPDFANYDFLTFITAMVPARSGTYTYGSQYLQLFTEPIPRKLWPGKPIGAPVNLFSLNQFGNFVGMTVTLAGDGWMSGGWIGLVITLGIVGLVLGLLHRWFWRNCDNNMKSLFYLIGLAMIPQWYRDGGISIAKFAFWNLSPLLLWLFVTWLIKGAQVPVEVGKYRGGTGLRFVRPAASEPRMNTEE